MVVGLREGGQMEVGLRKGGQMEVVHLLAEHPGMMEDADEASFQAVHCW